VPLGLIALGEAIYWLVTTGRYAWGVFGIVASTALLMLGLLSLWKWRRLDGGAA